MQNTQVRAYVSDHLIALKLMLWQMSSSGVSVVGPSVKVASTMTTPTDQILVHLSADYTDVGTK